jgi:hypothetical protein
MSIATVNQYIRLCGYDPDLREEWVDHFNATRRGRKRINILTGLPRAIGTGARHFKNKAEMRANAGKPIQPALKKRRAKAIREKAAAAILMAHIPLRQKRLRASRGYA